MKTAAAVSRGLPQDALPPSRDLRVPLLLLAWAAGSVDALTFLRLGHVFTANMTGNTVLLGLAVGQGEISAAVRSLVALGGFVLGVMAGAVIAGPDRGRGIWAPAVTRALSGEAVVLAAFAGVWHVAGPEPGTWPLHGLIGLSGLAMGIQSAAIRHLDVPGIATTYITGTLTGLVAGLVDQLRITARGSAGPPADSGVATPTPAVFPFRGLGLPALVFLCYGLAAVVAGMLASRWPAVATWLPLVVVGTVVLRASVRQWYGYRSNDMPRAT